MKTMLVCACAGIGFALWAHDFSEAMWAFWTAVLAYERITEQEPVGAERKAP